MTKEAKDKLITKLHECLIYPETVDDKLWHEAEIINQKILNLISEIIKK